MQWGKAKTVLIAVLLAVNIFLFLVTQQCVREAGLTRNISTTPFRC